MMDINLMEYQFTITQPCGRVHKFNSVAIEYRYAFNDVRKQYRKSYPQKKGNPAIGSCKITLISKEKVTQ